MSESARLLCRARSLFALTGRLLLFSIVARVAWSGGDAPAGQGNPLIDAMMNQVRSNDLAWLMRRFTGEELVYTSGEPGFIKTRRTDSGAEVARALQFAFERLQALGTNVAFQGWSLSGYTNRNIVATQPGTVRSNEWVLFTAHLDNVPLGPRAPGADDNASGSLAVLTAASVFSQYRFDRSIRFMLFTGEEQGLYGSSVQAGMAFTNGDNIIGVINVDMIAWDLTGGPVFGLFTRFYRDPGPGYSNDLALAVTFTNVVNDYGLGADITPVIFATGLNASDHASFWNRGFPAILVSEDYNNDFNPFYHSTFDTIARVNWKYYTAIVRALIGGVAHLAEPVETVPRDVMRLTAGNWRTNSGVGGRAFHAKILPTPAAAGLDTLDVAWSDVAAPPLPAWFEPLTTVAGLELQTDARPDETEVRFAVKLTAVITNGSALSTSNRLQFDFLAPARPDRVYLARVTMDDAFTLPATGFLCVTNLRHLAASGGQIVLPNLVSVTNGAVYGFCELVVRELNTNRNAFQLRLSAINGATVTLSTLVQVGAAFVDEVEATQAPGGGPWQILARYTNNVKPDAANYAGGWQELSYAIATEALPPADERFFRVRRVWTPQ